MEIENKKPKGYVEASFAGCNATGVVVDIDFVKYGIEEYSLLLCDMSGSVKDIGANNINVVPFIHLSSLMDSEEALRLCILYVCNGVSKVSFLRKKNLDVGEACTDDMYDRRMLFGAPVNMGDGRQLLMSYQVNGILLVSIKENTYIYMAQMKNEILYQYKLDDEVTSNRYCISIKCKKISGSYIGMIPLSLLGNGKLSTKCIEYSTYEESGDYAYMDFYVEGNDAEKYEEVAVVWSYQGSEYVAIAQKRINRPYATVIKIDTEHKSGLSFDILYDADMYGEYVKAELVNDVEEWDDRNDVELTTTSVSSLAGSNIVSVVINTLEALSSRGRWYIKLYTKKDGAIKELYATAGDNLISKELYDRKDTKYKVSFKKNEDLFLINRVFGHNALFKKNIQATGDITISEFLQIQDISLNGNMYAEYIEGDNSLKIRLYQQMSDVIEAKVVMYHSQGKGVLSTQNIDIVDGIVEEFEVKTPDIDWDKKFDKPVDSVWFRVAIAIRTREGIYLSTLTNYDVDTAIEQQGSIHDSRKLYMKALENNSICGVEMTALPYYAANKSLSMKFVRLEQLYRSQFTNELLDVKIKKDILFVKVRCRRCDGEYKGIVMEYRKVKEDDKETHFIPYDTLKEDKGWYIMTAKIDTKKYYMRMLYWDIRCAFDVEGRIYTVSCHSNKQRFLRKFKKVFVDRTYPNNNSIMFPFATGSDSVALMHREICPQDNWRFRLKEKFAEKIYKMFKNHWDKKNIYLIFEKYCTMAQDNGYFFFKYCMDEHVEDSFDGEIYYVIDKDAADWGKVVPYKEHVLKYLSVKHMVYLQACKLMISTDTKGHAYVWRSMGSNIKALSYEKKLVFLQHGVTAFKRGHFERGTNVGCESFITTSQFEHDIIHENLGYLDKEIPITGFARWDVLHDKSEGHREILMMPTWRTWLDDAENEVFAESDYCKNYMALLNDPRLDDILKRYDVTLNFYLHPKFRKFITEFSVVSDNIRLIPFGEEPLNELMMECNLLITDFSSVAWDVYYMNKPVLFYHFDLDDAYKTLGFYMDMRNDIFGERAEKPEELMQLIIEYIENDFAMKEKYSKDRKKYFAYFDDNNSERIWKSIQERKW